MIYTPNEIVRFMIESADWLCEKHFGKNLVDAGVEILDPATGTGTFICELLEHFRGQKKKLAHKYKEELHANEVAILPYYVANLNIEATYAAITSQYAEFPNLCFVDTLDNVLSLTKREKNVEHEGDLLSFGGLSEENVERVKRQNKRKISVIIGNPPYRANQQNENDNNKNRVYRHIDKRIKATYIKESAAQKTKGYDMYRRFFRWAGDRIDHNGVIALVTNNNLIEDKEADGFRKVLAREFNEIWIIDLKGDARSSGKRRRQEGGNVFSDKIKVGIAIAFCVKKEGASGCKVFYEAVADYAKADEKRDFIAGTKFPDRNWEQAQPDDRGNWINMGDEGFRAFLPISSKSVRAKILGARDQAIFMKYSLGVSTNRDDWIYDFDAKVLEQKMKFLNERYQACSKSGTFETTIKWSETLKKRATAKIREIFQRDRIRSAAYRPFVKGVIYSSELFIDRPGALKTMFPVGKENSSICFSDSGSSSSFCALAVDGPADLHFGAAVDAYQQVPLYCYATDGSRLDNITDWALDQFSARYKRLARAVTKDAIFHYVYAVLHDPMYREKYSLNLKREFPRIPFYKDFWRWAEWGERLMTLHIGYETVEHWPLKRTDTKDEKAARASLAPKPILKADKDNGIIVLDSETQLSGVPAPAWDYKLGNRSGLEWILDQYKEKTPKDPTIREKFDSYRFKDHKEKVVDLLKRVTRVSVETQEIITAMKVLPRG